MYNYVNPILSYPVMLWQHSLYHNSHHQYKRSGRTSGVREDWLKLEHRTRYDLRKEIQMLLGRKNVMTPGKIFI